MGYRIEYGTGDATVKPVRRKWWNAKSVLISAVSVVLAITLTIPVGREWVRQLLLPGDVEVTSAAMNGLLKDLKAGEDIGIAVEAFCHQIIFGE